MEILDLKNLKLDFKKGNNFFNVISGIDLKISSAQIVGIAGESGSGKTVSMLSLTKLLPASKSKIRYDSYKINGIEIRKQQIPFLRGRFISYIFQDAVPSLDPLFTVKAQLREIFLKRDRKNISDQVLNDLLQNVGLKEPERVLKSYPHQLSGGMAQRVAIALALATNSKILVADEPTTALDANLKRGILELLKELRDKKGLSIFFISHDLNQVFFISDIVCIFYAGRIVEIAGRKEIEDNPFHPYTVGLLRCSPGINKTQLYKIRGSSPDFKDLPSGCKFYPRCQYVEDICQAEEPPLIEVKKGHFVRCYRRLKNERHSKG